MCKNDRNECVLLQIKPEVFGVLFLFGHALSLKGLNALEVRHLPEYKIEEPFSLTEIYGTGLDKCKFCVQFAEQATSSILNIILSK